MKRVLIITNLTPNIIMHVFSCLEIEGSFYNSDYGLKHRFTILEKEYEEWEEIIKKCSLLDCSAELFAILFQIPSYIPAGDEIETIADSFDRIAEAIEEQSIEALIDSYPGIFDNLPIYAPLNVYDDIFKKLYSHKKIVFEILEKFKHLLENLWNRFYRDYWHKEAKKRIETRMSELNLMISPINIIKTWEKHLKMEYPFEEFNVVLVEPAYALATDLLAEKIAVSLNHEDMDFYKIIIHEVGRSFLLTTQLFEHPKLKNIAISNIDKLSLIVDAACIHIKKQLYKTFRIHADDIDPYDVPALKEITDVFGPIWDKMEEKDIFEALVQTYNKLSPIV